MKATNIGPHTVICSADKPELQEALTQAARDIQLLVETGDPVVHKRVMFPLRYGVAYADNDKRVYSRNSEEIKAYWRERVYPKPRLIVDNA